MVKIAAIGVIIVIFGMASALIANVSLNTAEAEFSPKILRQKIYQQVVIIKAKANPILQKVENFEVGQLLK